MWQKLQDKSLSWETRFKIAVCQWKRRDRLLRDNETTRMCILKWLTESVTNLHKSRIEQYVVIINIIIVCGLLMSVLC